MQIKTSVVSSLIEKLAPIYATSRRKNLTGEDMAKLTGDAVRAVRTVLTTLKGLKAPAPKKAVAKKSRSKR